MLDEIGPGRTMHGMEWFRNDAAIEPPRTFGSAAEALHWADAFALDPRLKDQLAKIKRRQIETPTKGGPSLQELSDLAHTISVELCRLIEAGEVSWLSGTLFRYIHGQRRHEDELAARLGAIAWNGPGAGGRARHKTTRQCTALASVVLFGKRGSEAFGHKPLSQSKIADRLGIPREQLRDQWADELICMRSEITRRLTAAASVFDARLRDMGIVE